MLVLLWGTLYEWKEGALDWEELNYSLLKILDLQSREVYLI